LDLRELYACGAEDFTGYRMPENYELSGRKLAISTDGGDRIDLLFSRKTVDEIQAGGGCETYRCACYKISESIFFAVCSTEAAGAVYILDMERALVTRVNPRASGESVCTFGFIGDNGTEERHAPTSDLDGNVVEWTLGLTPPSVVRLTFRGGTVSAVFPLAADGGPEIRLSDFSAVCIAEGIYLQCARIEIGERVLSGYLLSSFRSLLSIGCIFGVSENNAVYCKTFGAYGRLL